MLASPDDESLLSVINGLFETILEVEKVYISAL